MSDLGKAAFDLAYKNGIDRKILVPPRLQQMPIAMTTPPTMTLGARGGASQITSNIFIPSLISGSLNPVFRYSGDMQQAGVAFPDNGYVRNNALTPPFTDFFIEFDFDGTDFEFNEKSIGAPRSRVLVDEGQGYQYVNATPYADIATNDGGGYLRRITFASRMLRRVRIENNGYFGGLYVGPNDTVFPPVRPLGPKAIFFGDSFVEGTGGLPFMGMTNYVANFLGWEHLRRGSGGTGYINPNVTAGRVKFQDRVQHDIINYSPDVVIIIGGTNDTTATPSAMNSAAVTLYQTIKQGLPNAKVIVAYNGGIGSITTAVTDTRDAIKSAAAQCSIPFIDPVNGTTYDSKGNIINTTSAWFTGGGNTGTALQATGNRSYYVHTDNGHPSVAGHQYYGERLATEILRILN